eukprot:TRINITY_DN48769_c0_g1_i2.p3 TRINITY_DN48769_c0_g1~~TRINITY_DN48769_c0_g1_i2.p3  ORF type:complete len:132 (+),score=35.37 TRINITY_DN48769_c0_g1_i2:386-781(+)
MGHQELAAYRANTAAAAAACWADVHSFEGCCRNDDHNQQVCWQSEFGYDTCCLPELQLRLQRGLEWLSAGRHRDASHLFIDLWTNYVTTGTPRELVGAIFGGFEKAVAAYQQRQQRLPEGLSYSEVLFGSW